ncbi:MAG: type IV pilus modification protein PilV [Gammaproteobacteria bacterium]|nr:type IV pilus modification protein PilV [Gammaproteobacteria bacterium]
MSTLRNYNTGTSLIEVLVSVLVLSIGLLGLAMMQVQGMQSNTDAYLRTQASIFAYEIIDRMRANPAAASSGSYTVATTTAATTKITSYSGCSGNDGACNCADVDVTCSTSNLALYDLGKWYEEQARILPAASDKSTISKSGNEYTIVIRWMERELSMSQSWVIEL